MGYNPRDRAGGPACLFSMGAFCLSAGTPPGGTELGSVTWRLHSVLQPSDSSPQHNGPPPPITFS